MLRQAQHERRGGKGHARPLTPGEVALLRPIFGAAIDYPAVRIRHAAWWPLQPRNVVMAPDGDIWCHPTGGVWREDFAAAPIGLQTLFVHEATHVWQAQRGGRWFLPLARHPFCRYRYTLVPRRPFARYGLEQQAEIVAHAFLAGQGRPTPYPAEAYAALLADAFRPRP